MPTPSEFPAAEAALVQAAVNALAAETGRREWRAARHARPDGAVVYDLASPGCDYHVALGLGQAPDGAAIPRVCVVLPTARPKDQEPGAQVETVSANLAADTGRLVSAAIANARQRARYRLAHLGVRITGETAPAAKRARKGRTK